MAPKKRQIKHLYSVLHREIHLMIESRSFTITAGGADVMEKVHDKVQVNQFIIKALVVEFQQFLLFIAALYSDLLLHCGPIRTAYLSQSHHRDRNIDLAPQLGYSSNYALLKTEASISLVNLDSA